MSETSMLRLNLLGKPEVWLDGSLLTNFSTAKTEALLYYLAVTGKAHSREALAGLLWAEMPETKAKRNLTKSLSVLRRWLAPYLLIESREVGFRPDATLYLDVALLQTAAGSDDMAIITQAVELYRGTFLEGFYVKNALSFEEWMLLQRENLQKLVIDVLERAMTLANGESNFTTGLAYGRHLLELDPWRESAHRHVMTLLANNGQRQAAMAQYEKLRAVLDKEMGLEPMAETKELHRRLLSLETAVTHNLPPEPDYFIGRVERAHIIKYLNDPSCRLLSLIGPGGSGKTRLALQAAAAFVNPERPLEMAHFNDGVYFVDLTSVYLTPNDMGETAVEIDGVLATAVGEAMQFPFRSSHQPLQQIFTYLRDKHSLLVIDNFEDCLAGAHHLAALLRHAPNIKLLVTSRERLDLRQEWVLEIGGLPFPEAVDSSELHRLAQQLQQAEAAEASPVAGAVNLFVYQARRIKADYTLTPVELPHVIRICQLVEGSPLAIELAASWLTVLDSSEIVTEIQKSFDFLAASTRDLPPRHRSMRAVFEHSWHMLATNEQKVLQQLSVFRGDFERKAAEAVAGASLPILANLVNKSWLRVSEPGRYRLHELVRQYTAEKLLQTFDEMIAVRDKHSRYYAHTVRQHLSHLYLGALPEIVADIAREISNIRAGWRWATIAEYSTVLEDISSYVRALRVFYGRRGLFHEGLEMCNIFIQRIRPVHGQDASIEMTALLGQLTLWQGLFYHYLGDIQAAAKSFRHSLTLLSAQKSEMPFALKDVAGANHLLGMVEWEMGNYEPAKQAFQEAERLDKALDDPGYAAKSTAFMAILNLELGIYEVAQAQLEACIPILRQNRDYYYTSLALGALARLGAVQARPFSDVISQLRQNLEDSRAIKSSYAEAHTLLHLGITLYLSADEALAEAIVCLESSLRLFERIHALIGRLQAHYWLAKCKLALGLSADATQNFLSCLKESHEHGLLPLLVDSLVGLAALSLELETSHLSAEQIRVVLTLAQTHQVTSEQTRTLATKLSEKIDLEKATSLDFSLEQVVIEVLQQNDAAG